MTGGPPNTTRRPRDRQPREARREQLIQATIDAIGRKGYSATTIADVAKGANLSRGIVNFHFDSKEKLFRATLQHMTDDYTLRWQRTLAAAGNAPAAKLRALVDADFEPQVCAPRKMAAWFAFMAEARSSAIYAQLCGARDRQMREEIYRQCAALKSEAGYVQDEQSISNALYALLEGLWLRLMLEAPKFSRTQAREAARASLGMMFPRHFDTKGGLRPRA